MIDYADRVASIRDFVARIDLAAAQTAAMAPTSTRESFQAGSSVTLAESEPRLQVMYFPIQFIPVENASEPISAVLSPAGRLATMPTENRLVVVDYGSNIEMVRRVLEKIDRPVPQVRITALIYDISLQDVEQLGLNWNSNAKGNKLDADGDPEQNFSFDTTTLVPFAAGSPGGTATIRSLSRNFDITTVALLLQNANDARLLANPNVTVMNNETADMNSVQEIPFQQITASTSGSSDGVATTAFKEVGIKLNVTPTVASDSTIKLVVSQEFSRVAGFTDGGGQPIIDNRTANTTVRVANRNTLVIGGLRQRSDTGDFNGIPYLKDMQFFGPLFRSRNTTVRESELVIFLMPEIVGYQEAPLQREYLAQRTINGRLDRIPMAEGCESPNSANYWPELPAEVLNESSTTSPSTQLPPRQFTTPQQQFTSPQQQFIPSRYQNNAPQSNQSNQPKTFPLRKDFRDRYRAVGGTDENRRHIQESTSQATLSVKKDSRALMQLQHSTR